MVKSWHLTHFIVLLYLLTLIRPTTSVSFSSERGLTEQNSLSTYVFQRGITASVYLPSVCMLIMVLQTLPLPCGGEEITATLNAIIPGDITLGGLFPVHDKSTDPTMPCGRSINAERGIQVMLTFQLPVPPNRTLTGAESRLVPRRGRQPIYSEKLMKLKKYWSVGGDGPREHLLRSATARIDSFIFACIFESPVFLTVNTQLILFIPSPKPILYHTSQIKTNSKTFLHRI